MKQLRPCPIVGGKLVTSGGLVDGCVRLVDGRIDTVGAEVRDGDEVIDVDGKLVGPGLVDLQWRLRWSASCRESSAFCTSGGRWSNTRTPRAGQGR